VKTIKTPSGFDSYSKSRYTLYCDKGQMWFFRRYLNPPIGSAPLLIEMKEKRIYVSSPSKFSEVPFYARPFAHYRAKPLRRDTLGDAFLISFFPIDPQEQIKMYGMLVTTEYARNLSQE